MSVTSALIWALVLVVSYFWILRLRKQQRAEIMAWSGRTASLFNDLQVALEEKERLQKELTELRRENFRRMLEYSARVDNLTKSVRYTSTPGGEGSKDYYTRLVEQD
jgi:hypothetical protein